MLTDETGQGRNGGGTERRGGPNGGNGRHPAAAEAVVAQWSRALDKKPPQALEAEIALLGSMLLDPHVIGDVLQTIRSGDAFYRASHGAIYDALVHLYNNNQTIDLVMLHQRLADTGQLELVGGEAYLLKLAEEVPSPVGAPHYAQVVRGKALLRDLIQTSGEILQDAYTSLDEVEEVLDRSEKAIFELANRSATQQAVELRTLMDELMDQVTSEEGLAQRGLPSGFIDLDEKTNGLQPEEMIVIAGRPSMGKTAFAINIAEHLAVSQDICVGVFSLEMSRQSLAQRLLSSASGVRSDKLRRNMLSDQDVASLWDAANKLADAPLVIDDTPGLTLMQLRAKARRMHQRHGVKALLIDYLQLLHTGSSESRQQEVSELSRGIKALARELHVPVLCLSQLNRAAENRDGHKPRLADLRESGAIEQDADVVILLHREDYYHKDDPNWTDNNVAEAIIAKQRNGPTGVVKLHFNGDTTRFSNLAYGHVEE